MSITDIRPNKVVSVSCYPTDNLMYPVNTDLLSERRENCFSHIDDMHLLFCYLIISIYSKFLSFFGLGHKGAIQAA
jgi:hypothetical protein